MDDQREPIISIRGLVNRFGRQVVHDHLDLDVRRDEILGVVGGSEIPAIWMFADSLAAQLALVVLVPGLLALVFGWLAFRSRVTGVYLSILTQAMTLALAREIVSPSSAIVPALTFKAPEIKVNTVVLPAPRSPIRSSGSGGRTARRSRSWRAARSTPVCGSSPNITVPISQPRTPPAQYSSTASDCPG